MSTVYRETISLFWIEEKEREREETKTGENLKVLKTQKEKLTEWVKKNETPIGKTKITGDRKSTRMKNSVKERQWEG